MKNVYSLIISCLLFTVNCSAQIVISTIAGTGTLGFSGDGGPATVAQMNFITGIAIDDTGNLYVADQQNLCIRKVSKTGTISRFAGSSSGFAGDGGPATDAKMLRPWTVATDHNGNVYIADINNNRVRKVDKYGIISTIAGNGFGTTGDGGPATDAKLSGPSCITVDNMGNVYIGVGMNAVRKIDIGGMISTVAGNGTSGYSGDGGPATAAELYGPTGLTTDDSGNLYIAEKSNNTVRRVDKYGMISTFAGGTAYGFSGDGGAATAAKLYAPAGLASDHKGNIYITDQYTQRIRKVDASGIITTIAGSGASGPGAGGYSGDHGLATSAELKAPTGVAVDTSGIVYISDGNNYVVRKVYPGIVTLHISMGTSGEKPAIYPNPTGGKFTVALPTVQRSATISITDMSGKVVGFKLVAANAATNEDFTVSNLLPGIYIVNVATGGTICTEKVVVR